MTIIIYILAILNIVSAVLIGLGTYTPTILSMVVTYGMLGLYMIFIIK